MATVDLQIPPRSAYVGVIRLALAALARAAGFGEEQVDDLKIAVSEACANAVLSNEEIGSDAPVGVRWIDEDDRVLIEVSDHGPTIDPEDVDAEDSQGFSSRAIMSIALLKSLVDSCDFVPRNGGGMTTRLQITR